MVVLTFMGYQAWWYCLSTSKSFSHCRGRVSGSLTCNQLNTNLVNTANQGRMSTQKMMSTIKTARHLRVLERLVPSSERRLDRLWRSLNFADAFGSALRGTRMLLTRGCLIIIEMQRYTG
jgi:hypothetical protein